MAWYLFPKDFINENICVYNMCNLNCPIDSRTQSTTYEAESKVYEWQGCVCYWQRWISWEGAGPEDRKEVDRLLFYANSVKTVTGKDKLWAESESKRKSRQKESGACHQDNTNNITSRARHIVWDTVVRKNTQNFVVVFFYLRSTELVHNGTLHHYRG